jgi:hypothetical protein
LISYRSGGHLASHAGFAASRAIGMPFASSRPGLVAFSLASAAAESKISILRQVDTTSFYILEMISHKHLCLVWSVNPGLLVSTEQILK